MKTEKIHEERLLKFAAHLNKITNHKEFGLYKTESLIEVPNQYNISFPITYHQWVFKELPAVFDEWYFSEKTGSPVYEGYIEEEGTLESAIFFFELKLAEMCHIFDLKGLHNVNHFGGKQLNYYSDGPDMARNILALIDSRKMELK